MSRLIPTLATLAALGLAAGCASAPEVGETAGVTGGAGYTGVTKEASTDGDQLFWVDPAAPAARQVRFWQRQGRGKEARLLRRIAEQPAALWPAGDDPVPVIRAAEAAAWEGRTTLFVAYNIPHRDCGRHSAGGADGADAYRAWIGRFAEALGDSRALVVLEPDAVAHVVDGCTPGEYHAERERLLTDAVARIKQQARTKVYLDAGNPDWIKEPSKLVEPLRRAGIARADGFALNVSNFRTAAATRKYGVRLSRALDGAHFVVDTSRNGNGPLGGDRSEAWCNPPGRALGTRPTTRTGEPALDAYLWIKRPGDSDG